MAIIKIISIESCSYFCLRLFLFVSVFFLKFFFSVSFVFIATSFIDIECVHMFVYLSSEIERKKNGLAPMQKIISYGLLWCVPVCVYVLKL